MSLRKEYTPQAGCLSAYHSSLEFLEAYHSKWRQGAVENEEDETAKVVVEVKSRKDHLLEVDSASTCKN